MPEGVRLQAGSLGPKGSASSVVQFEPTLNLQGLLNTILELHVPQKMHWIQKHCHPFQPQFYTLQLATGLILSSTDSCGGSTACPRLPGPCLRISLSFLYSLGYQMVAGSPAIPTALCTRQSACACADAGAIFSLHSLGEEQSGRDAN